MKKLISILTLTALLSSCGLFKDRSVHNVVKHVDSIVKVDSAVAAKKHVVDRSETVVVEKAKGTAYTKPESTEFKSDLGPLLSGLQVVKDSGLFKIVQSYDSLTKQINTSVSVRKQAVDFDIDKTTTTKSDIKSSDESSLKYSKDADIKTNDTLKDTKSVSKVSGTWVMIIAFLVLGFVLFFGIKKVK